MVFNMKETTPIINIENLTKKFKSVIGINDISFVVHDGETLAIIGESGAGKTTLIRTMLGNLKATSGSAYIDGKDTSTDAIAIKEEVSYLPSEFSLFDLKYGSDFLKFIAKIDNSDKKIANELIKRFQLDINATPKRMSKGMKQKMALVSCFMKRSNIFILDEPSIGLDPLMREELHIVLKELKEKEKTIIFSSNDFEEIMLLADRVLILSKGKLVATIDINDLKLKNYHIFKFKILGTYDWHEFSNEIYEENDGYLTLCIEAKDISRFFNILSECNVIEFKVVPFNLESYIHRLLRGNENEK